MTMTIGEQNIVGATLNNLQSHGLISINALSKAFEKLELSQEHKGIYEDNLCDFDAEPCKYEEDTQNKNLKPCPFCLTMNLGVSASWVFCHNCNATGPVSDARFKGRELWNRRFDEKMAVEA